MTRTVKARKHLAHCVGVLADTQTAGRSIRTLRRASRHARHARRQYIESLYLSELEA